MHGLKIQRIMILDILAICTFFAGLVVLDRQWKPKQDPACKKFNKQVLEIPEFQLSYKALGSVEKELRQQSAASSSKSTLQ